MPSNDDKTAMPTVTPVTPDAPVARTRRPSARPRRVSLGDVGGSTQPARIRHNTVTEAVAAAEAATLAAVRDVIAQPGTEVGKAASLRAILEGASPDDARAIRELLQGDQPKTRQRTSPEVSPDEELGANWRSGAYPYKNLMSRQSYEAQKYLLQVELLKLQKHVVFTGRVPHKDVNRYYDLIDVLAYPRHSMRLTELVTPLKPLEAMAQGHLFVASDVGGHRELVEHKKTGILFKADDANALASALLDLLKDKESWPALRANGRNFVESVRNWRNSVAHYKPAYEAVMRGSEK